MSDVIEYVDFSIDGIDIRSTFGIYRTSDGSDGYQRNGLPRIESKTVDVPNGDGTYYFGDFYKGQDIKIPIAFDNLYREDWENFVATILTRDKYHTLIYSEQPYKKYYVRVNEVPDITFVPHDEDYDNISANKTIFKGMGHLSFICDDGYAVSVDKNPSYYTRYPNYNDFIGESGLIDLSDYDSFNQGEIKLYNGGHLPTDWTLTFTIFPDGLNRDYYLRHLVRASPNGNGASMIRPLSEIRFTSAGITTSPSCKIDSKTHLFQIYSNGNYESKGDMYLEPPHFEKIVSYLEYTWKGYSYSQKFYISSRPAGSGSYTTDNIQDYIKNVRIQYDYRYR